MRNQISTTGPLHIAIADRIAQQAADLVLRARDAGFDLTIEQRSLEPLAMGNWAPHVEVKLTREAMAKREAAAKGVA